MKIYHRFLIILVILSQACQQRNKEIFILPRIGIAVGMDTIKFKKTSGAEIFKILGIQNEKMLIDTGIACGETEDGQPFSINSYHGTICHDAFSFNYSSKCTQFFPDSFELEEIEIKGPTKYIIKINDSLVYGNIVRNVENYFLKSGDDTYTKYWYELDSYGLELGLKDTLANKKLDYVSLRSYY